MPIEEVYSGLRWCIRFPILRLSIPRTPVGHVRAVHTPLSASESESVMPASHFMVCTLVFSKSKEPRRYTRKIKHISTGMTLYKASWTLFTMCGSGQTNGFGRIRLGYIDFSFSSTLNCLPFAHIMAAEATECDATNNLSREGTYIGNIEILRLILG